MVLSRRWGPLVPINMIVKSGIHGTNWGDEGETILLQRDQNESTQGDIQFLKEHISQKTFNNFKFQASLWKEYD